jgi:shikimate 5-dehydrogenase
MGGIGAGGGGRAVMWSLMSMKDCVQTSASEARRSEIYSRLLPDST